MVMVMMPSMAFATDSTEESTGTSGSGETTYVAEIGETQYKTLTEAIRAATDNDTIILKDDTTESVTIPKDKTLTINLGRHKITNAENQDTITIESGAKLTVISSGTVDNVSHGRTAIYNNGTAILQGGDYTRSEETGASASTSGGTFSSDPTAYVAKDVKDLYIYKPSDKEFIVGGAEIGLEKHSCKDGNSYFELGETDTAIFSPKGVDACITWHSKDENVVTIDKKTGKLEAVGTGVADIYI